MKQRYNVVKSRILRIIFIVIGSLSLTIGTIGIFLPIIPTVPFYLLTAFCFVRGSKRFSDRFLNSKLYKKHVKNFAEHRVMVRYKECLLLLLVSAMLLVSLWFVDSLAMSIVFTVLIAAKYSYFAFKVSPVSKSEYLTIRKLDEIESQGE
jgi:uncharacterized membrane protein YbaN (DUF454 family)